MSEMYNVSKISFRNIFFNLYSIPEHNLLKVHDIIIPYGNSTILL